MKINTLHNVVKGGFYTEVWTNDGRLVHTTAVNVDREVTIEAAKKFLSDARKRVEAAVDRRKGVG